MDGLRACLVDEFTSVYVFNLRGNARTQGEQRRMEKGNVFGEGTRTPVAISLLVKNPDKRGKGELHYHDIGDYLDREEKLGIIRVLQSINGLHRERKWTRIQPNTSHDWINQRDPAFENYVPLGAKSGDLEKVFFENYSLGVGTNRDAWAYNFSQLSVRENMRRTIEFYNEQVEAFKHTRQVSADASADERLKQVEAFIDKDPKKISWSSSLIPNVGRGVTGEFSDAKITVGHYRPFSKQRFFYDGLMNHRVGQFPNIWPTGSMPNLVIATTGIGAARDFSALIADCIPNLHMHDSGQCFPLTSTKRTSQRSQRAAKKRSSGKAR
jgi:predicted helicase